tara:strand:- start:36 stop:1013 length:978 start_codon:yes stop_codon:yes gene_type:complete
MYSWKDKSKRFFARKVISYFEKNYKRKKRKSNGERPVKLHYDIMMFFRKFFARYEVKFEFRHPFNTDYLVKLCVDLCENNQQWFFRLQENYDKNEIKILSEELKFTDEFIDVGANVGFYTVSLGLLYPDKKVISCEPLPKNYDFLKKNILLNRLNNVEVLHTAVSTQTEPLEFYVNPIHDGGGSLIKPEVYKTGDVEINVEEYKKANQEFKETIKVDCARLDQLVTKKSILKIDVEGAELFVLESGSAVFKKGLIPVLLVEVLRSNMEETLTFLRKYNYAIFKLPNLEVIDEQFDLESLDWFVLNLICVQFDSPSHARMLERIRG